MAHSFLKLLILIVLLKTSLVLSASNDLSLPFHLENCTAPPPDSFRITGYGYDFVDLAWVSQWPGASQHLTVLKQETNGSWTIIFTFPNLTGQYFTVFGLGGGINYKFKIATNCNPDDPSSLTSEIDMPGVIVELTLAGSTPINPTPIPCEGIPYEDYAWVGFQINGNGQSAIFEFEKDDKSGLIKIRIKRVGLGPIVTANLIGQFPTPVLPIVDSEFIINILDLSISPSLIGCIELKLFTGPDPSLNICPCNNIIWKRGYTFTPLITELEEFEPKLQMNSLLKNLELKNYLTVSNPISNVLKVSNKSSIENKTTRLKLLNLAGVSILEDEHNFEDGDFEMNVFQLVSGIYFLEIETKDHFEVHKIIKN